MVGGGNLANSGAGDFTATFALSAGHASELVRIGPTRLRTAGGGAGVIISSITAHAPGAVHRLCRCQGRGDPFAGKIGAPAAGRPGTGRPEAIVDDLACFKGVLLLSQGDFKIANRSPSVTMSNLTAWQF
jgi:hypothetical protein